MPSGAYYIDNLTWFFLPNGEPCIRCDVDGKPCFVTMMQKTVLLDQNIVMVQGDIDAPEVTTSAGDVFPAGSGAVVSPSLALEVEALTDAYAAGSVQDDPRYTGAA